MEKSSKLILGVIVTSLFLGWLIEPALVVIAGGILWMCILLVTGGAEDGNPYRTMNRTPVPPVVHVGRFMKQQKV